MWSSRYREKNMYLFAALQVILILIQLLAMWHFRLLYKKTVHLCCFKHCPLCAYSLILLRGMMLRGKWQYFLTINYRWAPTYRLIIETPIAQPIQVTPVYLVVWNCLWFQISSKPRAKILCYCNASIWTKFCVGVSIARKAIYCFHLWNVVRGH